MTFVNWRQGGVGHSHFWSVYLHTRVVWYMLPCKHHCTPQSMSLFYLRVVLGYLQLLPWEESNKVIEQFSTSIWVWVHTRDVQLNYLTILWWSKTLWCLPQLWTLVSGVLEVSWVLKQFSHFTVSSPTVDKPEHNVTKLTNLTILTHFWQTWRTWPMFDQLLTKFWSSSHGLDLTNLSPTCHQLFTNLTNFSPTWPDNKQPTAKQIELNRLSFGDASKNKTYTLNYNNYGLWTKQLSPIINMGISENAMSVFSLKVHIRQFFAFQYPFGGSTHENW